MDLISFLIALNKPSDNFGDIFKIVDILISLIVLFFIDLGRLVRNCLQFCINFHLIIIIQFHISFISKLIYIKLEEFTSIMAVLSFIMS
jgi:hypothetical protein